MCNLESPWRGLQQPPKEIQLATSQKVKNQTPDKELLAKSRLKHVPFQQNCRSYPESQHFWGFHNARQYSRGIFVEERFEEQLEML
jgi:ribosomal protein S30